MRFIFSHATVAPEIKQCPAKPGLHHASELTPRDSKLQSAAQPGDRADEERNREGLRTAGRAT